MPHKTEAIAPGKVILSGEHAVVYGQPALAAAIDRQVHTTVYDLPDQSNTVSFSLHDHKPHKTYSWECVQQNSQKIWHKHRLYRQSKGDNNPVIQHPFELLQVILVHTLQRLNLSPSLGIHLRVQSHIPIGCGLGSSASFIVSVMHAVASHFGMKPSQKWYYEQAVALENLQHAQTSGIDPYICLHGGFHLFQNGQSTTISPPTFPLLLVHTGTPQSCTAQCVLAVKSHWAKSNIWSEFAQVTHNMHQALQNHNLSACQQAIRRNHQLLTQLGVVPKRVAQLIAEVEQQGAAAKVCGAGAIQGHNGGMVWVLASNPSFLPHLCKQYGYSHATASVCMQGVQVLSGHFKSPLQI